MVKIYRVVVRGQFANLDDSTREALLADQEEHDFLVSAFTSDGTFTYDERLVAFNLRYEVRDGSDEPMTTIDQLAIDRASAWLDQQGYGHKRLRATVTDMASMWADDDRSSPATRP
jgi:hypothetical protein